MPIRRQIEIERVREFVVNEIEKRGGMGTGGLDSLAKATGVNERVLGRIVHGLSPYEQAHQKSKHTYISFNTLDKLLCGTRSLHLFYTSPEAGGFSDVYHGDNTYVDRRTVLKHLKTENAMDAWGRVTHQIHIMSETIMNLESKLADAAESSTS